MTVSTSRILLASAAALLLAACGNVDSDVVEATDTVMSDAAADVENAAQAAADKVKSAADSYGSGDGMEMSYGSGAMYDGASLTKVLAMQDEAAKARFDARNPAETLEFFGIAPGMAVGDALPGGGWYSKILLPYLGSDGRMVGVNYSDGLWDNFGWPEERVAARKAFPETWPAQAREWTDTDIPIEAYTFETLPQDGSLDAFLFIRALHNLARFEGNGGFMTEAAKNAYGALKPGGVVGVVQHEAPADATDEFSTGSAGYLRRADVVAAFEAAGFKLEASSDINANPMDVPSGDDIVWRLPPSLATSREDAALKAKMEAIGESNRMTLRFRKPA